MIEKVLRRHERVHDPHGTLRVCPRACRLDGCLNGLVGAPWAVKVIGNQVEQGLPRAWTVVDESGTDSRLVAAARLCASENGHCWDQQFRRSPVSGHGVKWHSIDRTG